MMGALMVVFESATLTGKSGATYSFLVVPFGTPLSAAGVVYALLRDQEQQFGTGRSLFALPIRSSVGRRQWTVLYVGQTENLSQRFERYEMDDDLARINASHIAVIGEPSAEHRTVIERDLIRRYVALPRQSTPCRRRSLVESITITPRSA